MPRNISTKPNGYIALISAVVISILLIAITFTLSFTAFYSRFNVLDSEFKKISSALASACINTSMLKLANDPNYIPAGGGDTIIIDQTTGKECKILSITPTTPMVQKTIHAQAVFGKAYTNLEVQVTPSLNSMVVDSWQELANF